ncbi:MAG: hypothetical protein AAGI01_13790 [Myxococcota bacterium]
MLLKPPGDQRQPPSPWAPVGARPKPDYSRAAMFPDANFPVATGVASMIEIDAQSSGNDFIPEPSTSSTNDFFVPRVDETTYNWLAYTISVSKHTQVTGSTYLSTVDHGKRGADLVSYYTAESHSLHPSFRGQVIAEQSGAHLGFGPSSDHEVDALDFGVGVITFDPTNGNQGLLFPDERNFYFSVTQQFVDAFLLLDDEFAYEIGQAHRLPPHAADIYRITWTWNAAMTGGSWGAPIVVRRASELAWEGVVPADVDGLGINGRQGESRIIFSVAPQPANGGPFPQLLYYFEDPAQILGTTTRVRQLGDFDTAVGSSIVPVTGKFGMSQSDPEANVDAVCVIDPSDSALDSMVGIAHTSLTDPLGSQWSLPGPPMIVSMQRAYITQGPSPTIIPLSGEGVFVHVSGFGQSSPNVPSSLSLMVNQVHQGEQMEPGLHPFHKDNHPLDESNWRLISRVRRTGDTSEFLLTALSPNFYYLQVLAVNSCGIPGCTDPMSGSLCAEMVYRDL